MKIAYAYTRVSTTQQDTDGKSGLTRQLDSIKEFLKSHPDYRLSEKVISDTASGYHGMNIKDDGGLGRFLRDCEEGSIRKGDMLCVELVDRLSRLPAKDSRALVEKILSYGVRIAIVRWGIVIDNDENVIDLGNDVLLTVGFHLARMESDQKAKRVQAAKNKNVEKARAGEKILFSGRSVPRWLTLNEDKTQFSIKVNEANKIKRIFDMKLSGMGANKIMTTLHEEGDLDFSGKPLTNDQITRLLKNRRVIGEWQPQHRKVIDGKRVNTNNGEPIKGYFPSVISEELFNAVQASFDQSAKGKASRGFNNVFSSLIKCSKCGYGVTQKVSYSKGKVYKTYLSCIGRSQRKVCDRGDQHMNPVRDGLLQALNFLDYSRIYERDTNQENLKRGDLEQRIKDKEKAINNYSEAVGEAKSDILRNKYIELSEKAARELSELNAELSHLNNAMALSKEDSLRSVADINLESEEERIKLNALLRQHIDKIVIEDNGFCTIHFKVGYKEIKRVFVHPHLVMDGKPFMSYMNDEDCRKFASMTPKELKKLVAPIIEASELLESKNLNAKKVLERIFTQQ